MVSGGCCLMDVSHLQQAEDPSWFASLLLLDCTIFAGIVPSSFNDSWSLMKCCRQTNQSYIVYWELWAKIVHGYQKILLLRLLPKSTSEYLKDNYCHTSLFCKLDRGS
nr:uncharacterized protein LOC127295631 [Lolium perenne]